MLGWTGNRMEYVVLTVEELRSSADRSEPIIDSWRADCVTVLGRPFEALLAPTVTVSRRHRL